MPSTYTPNLNLELQATGEHDGTWGNELNTNVFSIIDSVLGTSINIALSSGTVNLTTSQTQNGFFVFSGNLTGNVTVNFPNISRLLLIRNNTTGNFTVTVQTPSSPSGVIVPQNSTAFVILVGNGTFRGPDAFGAATPVASGNLAMFTDSTGRVIGDSGVTPPIIANEAQAEAGTDNTVYMTPLGTNQYVTARIASQTQAQAGTDNLTGMTPLRTAQAIGAQATAYPSTSGDPNLLNFPIGAVLMAIGTPFRNAPLNIYLDAADITTYRTSSNGGTVLQGLWLARGRADSYVLVQRIS